MDTYIMLSSYAVTQRSYFNIKILSYQYRKSHCGDKMIIWPTILGPQRDFPIPAGWHLCTNLSHYEIFTHNSNLMENSFFCNSFFQCHIFCTYHNNTAAVIPCEKMCVKHFLAIRKGAKWNFHETWLMMKIMLVRSHGFHLPPPKAGSSSMMESRLAWDQGYDAIKLYLDTFEGCWPWRFLSKIISM